MNGQIIYDGDVVMLYYIADGIGMFLFKDRMKGMTPALASVLE